MTTREQLARRGIKYQTFYSRITRLGWTVEQAMSLPPAPRGKYGKYRPTPRRLT